MKKFRVLLVLLICFVVVFGSETEIVSKRSFTSKTYSVDNGQLKQVVYPYLIHYLLGSEYVLIPEGESADYYRELASSQMKKTTSKFDNFLMTTSSTGSPTLGKKYIENVCDITYNSDLNYPFYLGRIYSDSDDWSTYRVLNNWNFSSFNSDYVIDSTIYELTMPAGMINSDNLIIQWMFSGWTYEWNCDDEDEYDAIGDGVQLGTITIDNGFSSSQTKTIKWNSGSGLSDSLQSMFDNGYGLSLWSGLKTNRESTTATNYVQIDSQHIIVYYHPPKKMIAIDNTIYNTSTSIGGELEITSGTLPPETDPSNDAGDDIVLYEDSTYTISEPEDEITYSSVDYTHHSWKENSNDYELDHNFEVDDELEDQVGWFKELKNVTISKQYGDGSIWIKDPWWVDSGERHNPPVYKTFSGSNYSVFLDQNPSFVPTTPSYILKAQQYVGKSDGIYEFSGWSVTSGSASFDSSSNRITKVCVTSENTTIAANYNTKVSNQTDYTATIPSGDSLSIPPNATIQFANYFTLEVEGSLTINGTESQPITLQSTGKAGTFTDPYTSVPTITDHLIISKGSSSFISMTNVLVKDTYCGLSIEADDANIALENVEIENCNVGVFIDNPNGINVEFNNLNIHDCHVGILFDESLADEDQTSGVLIHHSVFSDIDYQGIFLFFGYPSQTISPSSNSTLDLIMDFCTFANIGSSSNNGNAVYTYNDNNYYGNVNLLIYESIFHTAKITLPIYQSYWTINSGYNYYYNSGTKPNELYASTTNPLLIKPSSHGDYRLQYLSPAIDEGYAELELELFPEYSYSYDSDNTDADIGAYYCPQTSNSGAIDTDTTWYGIVTVTGDVSVSNSVELTIDPGTMIKFNVGKELGVYGDIDVNGTFTSPVVFTRSDPSSTSKTYWDGIRMYSGSSFDLDYIKVYGASRGVYSYYSTGSIDYSRFEENTYGFYGSYSDYVGIRNNTFYNNSYGCKMNYSDPINLIGNIFSNSQYYGAGYVRSYGTVNQNTFSGNSSYGMYITSIANVNYSPQTYYLGSEEDWSINNNFSNNGTYNVYIGSSGYADLGTYELISEVVNEVMGGFNYFVRGSASYDIYNASSYTIPAEVNWWSSMSNYGNVDTSPTAVSLGFSLPKSSSPVNYSILQEEMIKALKLVRDSLYTDAISMFNEIVESGPDDPVVYPVISNLAKTYDIIGDSDGLLKNLETLYAEYPNKLVGIVAVDYSISLLLKKGLYDLAINRSEEIVNGYLNLGNYEDIAWALYQQGIVYKEVEQYNGLNKVTSGQTQKNFEEILTNYSDSEAAREVAELLAVEIPTTELNDIPTSFNLNPAYPNPFNPKTTISFDLPEKANVEVAIYDLNGREVWNTGRLNFSIGTHSLTWNGTNHSGQPVGTGVYLIRFNSNRYSATQKVVLMK